jgi:hypothetical protein
MDQLVQEDAKDQKQELLADMDALQQEDDGQEMDDMDDIDQEGEDMEGDMNDGIDINA